MENFTVIIPTKDRPAETLRAIRSVLVQECKPSEIIVVDDGSQIPFRYDGAEENRVRILRHEKNRGPSAARNTGLDATKTDWITFLDSDDWLLPGSIKNRLSDFSGDDDVYQACGWRIIDAVSGGHICDAAPSAARTFDDHFGGIWFSPGSCVFLNRKTFLKRVGFWDESLPRYEDFDWFCRAAEAGLRLEVTAVCGVTIARHRQLNPAKALEAAKLIEKKWINSGLGDRRMRLLRAYLAYELAASNYYAGNYFKFATELARSWSRLPRFSMAPVPLINYRSAAAE